MSMIACHECKTQISSAAEKCPHCGAIKRMAMWKKAVIALFVLPVALGIFTAVTGPDVPLAQPAAPVPKTPEQIREEAEFKRVVLVARSIKAASKNPDSFKLESAMLTAAGTVCVEYRATNSFNAVVPGYASSREDKISTSAGDWNRHCAGKTGKDYKYVRQAL